MAILKAQLQILRSKYHLGIAKSTKIILKNKLKKTPLEDCKIGTVCVWGHLWEGRR
jgi:hypothetical protein